MSRTVPVPSAVARNDRSMPRPLVLMTPDLDVSALNPTEAEYIVRVNYADAIAEVGGMPMILPYHTENIGAALELCDGVVITGSRPGVRVEAAREAFESALIAAAIGSGVPLLGICHGMQLIGQHLGGRVVTGPDGDDGPSRHIPQIVPDRTVHGITLAPDMGLSKLTTRNTAEVNSLHRHVLMGPGQFRIAARADDGVIEAIEGEATAFCLGVQWHPEYRLTELDRAILATFVSRCAVRAATRHSHVSA